MKKFLAILLTMVLLFSYVVPFSALAVENTYTTEENIMNVDYDEFHNNRAYYDKFLDQGYTIYVYVGDEHADEEIERRNRSRSGEVHHLDDSDLSRGTSYPTEDRWNIHEQGPYNYDVDTRFERIYTEFLLFGCDGYLIDGYNYNANNNLKISIYNTINGLKTFSVPPQTEIYRTFGTTGKNAEFAVAFDPPAEAIGTINCLF